MARLTIHIIGGTGKMGQWLKHFLENNHISVTISNRDYLSRKDLIQQADIVVVAVPISQTEKTIKTLLPLMPKNALLTDMTSVKTLPLSAMEKAPCATLGMHPLFGPNIGSPIGQKIVFCRQKDNNHVEFLKALFEVAGMEVVEMTAEEHDYQVAYIQALTHASHLLYAKTILGQEKTILTKLQTPTFALHALTMGRILHQDLDLMADIQLYNPYFLPVVDNLVENSHALLKTLQKGDKKDFIKLFEKEQKLAKNFSGLSIFQTNKILRLLSETPANLPHKTSSHGTPKRATVAYLGPEGTYSQMAALHIFPQTSYSKKSCNTLFDVFQKVLNQDVDFGVVPAENSLEGTVRSTMDYLADFSLYVCGSFEIAIHQQLLSREKDLSTVTTVVSHPQALAQCKQWLTEHLPNAKLITAESTTAQLASSQKGYAYIASEEAAKTYHLSILAKDIEDDPTNTTRFYVIAKHPIPLKGVNTKKALLLITVYNRVGILRDILTVFAEHSLNLSKLESRPSHEKLWDYHFFIEVEKEQHDPSLAQALQELEAYCPVIRILGQT